jgi:carboxypeptidase family protein
MRRFTAVLFVLSCVLLLPTLASAQASITGVVQDASGAVLPGVTVEASSPALIEKVRTGVTDGNGRFQIVDLRPGPYRVTFSLTGFSTVVRDGIELTGSSVARIDAELRVGTVQESVTVTGEAPTVDVQTVKRQQVLSAEMIDALPTARNYVTLARLIPGTIGGGNDVGGSELQGTGGSVSIHGSRIVDQRVTLNGISTMTLQAGGNVGGQIPDVGSAQEITVDSSGLSAELATGGIRINFIPRDGGNTFANSTFFTFSNGGMQGSNFTQRLKDAGLGTPNAVKHNYDLNESFGGPLRRDRVWFWFSTRYNEVENYAPVFVNKNAFDASKWLYEADTSQRGINKGRSFNNSLRMTWQATPRNKIAGTYKVDQWCQCPNFISATRAPEASFDRRFPRLRQEHIEWTSPATNRLLFEAVALHLYERWGNMQLQKRGSLDDTAAAGVLAQLISVQEQSTGLVYRMGGIGQTPSTLGFNNTLVPNFSYRAAMSYVTGTHNVKVGFNRTHGYLEQETYNYQPYQYRFNNGIPNQVTLFATPFTARSNQDNDLGLFGQDQWSLNRMTVNLALRYDYFATSFPEQHVGPGPLVPTRNLTFPAQKNLAWHDLTYRTGFAYDVRGNGKTAIKVTFNKYLLGQTLNTLGSNPNPVNTLVNSAIRSWTDNGNFVPDCDLINPIANGECGPTSPGTFGSTRPAEQYDPDLLRGFGHRMANWEFSAGVQHELRRGLAVDVAYFRRIWGNFQVTDNLALAPEDFTPFSLTVPSDPRLPDNGGYTVTGLYNLKPEKFGLQQNFNTLSDKYGKQIEHWDGVDVNLSARLSNGLMFQGGLSSGRTLEDNCEIVAKLPEMLDIAARNITDPFGAAPAMTRPAQYCHRQTPMLTQFKLYGVYTIPKVELELAGTLRSMPGNEINAAFVATNPYLAASSTLGRALSGSAPNMTIGLLRPNSKFLERRNELDLRFGKVLRAGKSRSVVSLDIYNALNTDALINVNQSFAVWMRPTEILNARLAKISIRFDF